MKRVFRLHLSGSITGTTFNKLQKDLATKLWIFKPSYITLNINCIGGSVIQAKNIGKLLRNFGEEHGAPFYTFADDMVLGAGNILLSSGHRVYANEYSTIGDFGSTRMFLGVKQTLAKYNVEMVTTKAGRFKDRLNTYENLRKADQNFLDKIGKENDLILQSEVLKLRTKNFRLSKASPEQVNDVLFQEGPLENQELLDIGYLDGIAQYEEIKHKTFHDEKETKINLTSEEMPSEALSQFKGIEFLYNPSFDLAR